MMSGRQQVKRVGPSVRVAVALAQDTEVCRLTWAVRGVVGVWWWVPVVAAVVVVARLIVRLIVMRLMIVRVWVVVVLQQLAVHERLRAQLRGG